MSAELEAAIEKLLSAEAAQDEVSAVRAMLAEWRERLDEIRVDLDVAESDYRDAEEKVVEAERHYAAEVERAREAIELATQRAVASP